MSARVTIVANAILAVLHKDIAQSVPNSNIPFFGNPQTKALAAAPALAGECAAAAIAALDSLKAST